MTVKIMVFCDVMCMLVDMYQCFRGTC